MKIFTGKVISKKMDKTANVLVERVYAHPVYKKRIKRTKKYHVHDILGAQVGQTVHFKDSKPFSKTKKWIITGIVENLRKERAEKKVNKRPAAKGNRS